MRITNEVKLYIKAQLTKKAMLEATKKQKKLTKKYAAKIKKYKELKKQARDLCKKRDDLRSELNRASNYGFDDYKHQFYIGQGFNVAEKLNEVVVAVEYADKDKNVLKLIAKLIKEV